MFRNFLVAALVSSLASSADANPCETFKYQPSSSPHLKAGSVQNNELDQHLNASKYAHGIQFDIEQNGDDLRVDLIAYPKEVQLVAGLFMLLQVARLAQDDFERLVLVDQGEAIFSFDGRTARKNGCQALWGVSAAGSPLPLLVDMMGAAQDADGIALIPKYTGSWLSDMNIALEAFNTLIAPNWIYSTAN
jgi:hypothetical protein